MSLCIGALCPTRFGYGSLARAHRMMLSSLSQSVFKYSALPPFRQQATAISSKLPPQFILVQVRPSFGGMRYVSVHTPCRSKAIRLWSDDAATTVLRSVPPDLRKHLADGGDLSLQQLPHTVPFLRCGVDARRVAEIAAASTSRSSVSHRRNLWDKMHQGVMHDDCRETGPCPALQKKRFDAQRCVCSGDGGVLGRFHTRLQAAFHAANKGMTTGSFRTWLCGGDLVLRLRQRSLQVPSDATDGMRGSGSADPSPPVGDSVVGESWWHIALMYLRPWRPTFLSMRRRPPFDRAGALGLQALRSDTDPSILSWWSVWDVVAYGVNLDHSIDISWYRLVGDARTTIDIEPSKQRAVALDLPEALVWRGKANERSARRAPMRRGPRVAAEAEVRPLLALCGPAVVGNDASLSPNEGDVEEDGAAPENPDDLPDASSTSSSESDGRPRGAPGPVTPIPGMVSNPPHAAVPAPMHEGPEVDDRVPFEAEHIEAVLDLIGAPRPSENVPVAPEVASAVAAEVAPAVTSTAPRVDPAPPRAPAAVSVILPGLRGMMRHYRSTNTVVMHCAHHSDANCRLTRTLNGSSAASRQGQGRPLGLLFAWSFACDPTTTACEHVHSFVPSLEQRQAARQELHRLAAEYDAVRELLALERPRRPGEPDEPERIA